MKVGALVFFVFILSLFWKPTQNFLYPIFSPLVNAYVSIRDTGTGIPHAIITYFTDRNAYNERIKSLEERIEYLENELAFANVLFDDSLDSLDTDATSTDLRDLSGRLAIQKLYPLARDITTMYNTILVSGGFDDGLEEGMIVYVRGYEAVGFVAKVHKSSSIINLYSAGGARVEGVIKDIDMTVTLQGAGGGSYVIEAPKSVDLAVGQQVFLAQNPLMVLGDVVEVTDDPQDTFIRAYVRGAYNPNKAHIFYVDRK